MQITGAMQCIGSIQCGIEKLKSRRRKTKSHTFKVSPEAADAEQIKTAYTTVSQEKFVNFFVSIQRKDPALYKNIKAHCEKYEGEKPQKELYDDILSMAKERYPDIEKDIVAQSNNISKKMSSLPFIALMEKIDAFEEDDLLESMVLLENEAFMNDNHEDAPASFKAFQSGSAILEDDAKTYVFDKAKTYLKALLNHYAPYAVHKKIDTVLFSKILSDEKALETIFEKYIPSTLKGAGLVLKQNSFMHGLLEQQAFTTLARAAKIKKTKSMFPKVRDIEIGSMLNRGASGATFTARMKGHDKGTEYVLKSLEKKEDTTQEKRTLKALEGGTGQNAFFTRLEAIGIGEYDDFTSNVGELDIKLDRIRTTLAQELDVYKAIKSAMIDETLIKEIDNKRAMFIEAEFGKDWEERVPFKKAQHYANEKLGTKKGHYNKRKKELKDCSEKILDNIKPLQRQQALLETESEIIEILSKYHSIFESQDIDDTKDQAKIFLYGTQSNPMLQDTLEELTFYQQDKQMLEELYKTKNSLLNPIIIEKMAHSLTNGLKDMEKELDDTELLQELTKISKRMVEIAYFTDQKGFQEADAHAGNFMFDQEGILKRIDTGYTQPKPDSDLKYGLTGTKNPANVKDRGFVHLYSNHPTAMIRRYILRTSKLFNKDTLDDNEFIEKHPVRSKKINILYRLKHPSLEVIDHKLKIIEDLEVEIAKQREVKKRVLLAVGKQYENKIEILQQKISKKCEEKSNNLSQAEEYDKIIKDLELEVSKQREAKNNDLSQAKEYCDGKMEQNHEDIVSIMRDIIGEDRANEIDEVVKAS